MKLSHSALFTVLAIVDADTEEDALDGIRELYELAHDPRYPYLSGNPTEVSDGLLLLLLAVLDNLDNPTEVLRTAARQLNSDMDEETLEAVTRPL